MPVVFTANLATGSFNGVTSLGTSPKSVGVFFISSADTSFLFRAGGRGTLGSGGIASNRDNCAMTR